MQYSDAISGGAWTLAVVRKAHAKSVQLESCVCCHYGIAQNLLSWWLHRVEYSVLVVCGSVKLVFNCFLFAPVASRENDSLQAVIICWKGWRQNKLNVPTCTFKKQKNCCNIPVTLWNNLSSKQFQGLQRLCQNKPPKRTHLITWDILGEHAQGTQHLLRPSICWLTVESQTVEPHHKAPMDFQRYEISWL